MTLSPTSGYILPSEMRAHYEVRTGTESRFLALDIINRPQPDGARDDDKYGYLQDVKIKYNDGGGTTSLDRQNQIKFIKARADFEETGSSAVTTWSDFEETDQKTNGSKVVISGTPSGIDLRLEKGIFSSYYTGTGGTFGTSIDAIQIERVPDNLSSNQIETTGAHKDTPDTLEWTPFDENECCSAFIMKELVVTNTQVINANTSESRTYPIFRAKGGVS